MQPSGVRQQLKQSARLQVFPGRIKSGSLTAIKLLLAHSVTIAAPLEHAPVRQANPLKGFMPFIGSSNHAIAHSMEFFYLPLKDLMTGPRAFDWNPLDSRLDAIAGRGRQAVFRVYLDYPKQPSGVPDFLRPGPDGVAGSEDDLVMRRYDAHGNQHLSCSPDYADKSLRAALVEFIAALGDRYDGDPRIGFLQLGLLGFWGEWHTYPFNGDKSPDWQPPFAVQEEILAAYDKAFDRTLVLVREPKAAFFKKYQVGYHDDSFAHSTIAPPSWHFGGKLAAYDESVRWRCQPIGGEIRPELQPDMWEDPWIVPTGQDFARCVTEMHASWLLAHAAFSENLSAAARERAAEQSRALGYEFHASSAGISLDSETRRLKLNVTLRNLGVAPFYYPWPLELAVMNSSGEALLTSRPDWSLTGLLPGDPDRIWSHEMEAKTLPKGRYHLLLRAVNPLARGLPLRFANTTQDANLPGWLTLGGFNLP